MPMQKEKMINIASKQNSKLDGRPAQSQKKRYTLISLSLFCYFLVTLCKIFPAWPNEMQVFTSSFVFILLTELNMVYIQKLNYFSI